MYRLVASDMDETFLGEHHRIPEANLEALRRMREAGVLFVPSSGRPYPSIMGNFADIDQSLMEGTYVISYNGGFINRYGDPKPLFTTHIDHEVADELYRRGIELGLVQHLYGTEGRTLVIDTDADERAYVSSLPGIEFFSSEGHPDVASYFGDGEVVKSIYASTDFAMLHELGERLRPALAEKGVDVTYSSGRYLEFVEKGVNKGLGLTRLAGLLGIPVSETVGVGDSANDLAMIEVAGLGVGVANVTDDVRPHCDLVLDTPAKDGAFGELFERVIKPSL